ncbi:NAD-dependent epimerase/dehydratase family protein [Aliiroseovarius sp. S1339]|uniref:NAD-dependent epimerase/dehydratase family protein n=1 Tax=Aliiroseovarius sp. S1339 TaxID=2936990 RepID=UPI0020BF4454|nr:NAD-dependent epimerase/dehydratase family protein [Aliiroseovarius sp. S1339]MCK8463992.1 NAD-dependent epimerase/dehydratase family protein [Aliiroseovarius sp. S1339]
MATSTVLVIGGSGFIGKNLVEQLLKDGAQVRSLDLGPSGIAHDRLSTWSGSFLQTELLNEVMMGVECVYHLAATAMPREADLNPHRDCLDNVGGTLGVLDAALGAGVKRVVFSSSGGTVYGPTDSVPIKEDQPTHPINAYGVSKLACEKYLRLYDGRMGKEGPLSTVSLRIANPYGLHQNISKAQGALTTFCARAAADEPISIWGDGEVQRDFINVSDVARALIAAGMSDVSGLEINIGSGKGTSLNALIKEIEAVLGHPINCEYLPARSIDVKRNYLDISKAENLLNWRPEVKLQDGIRQLLDGFRGRITQ